MLAIVWGVFTALAIFGIICSMGNLKVGTEPKKET